MSNQNKILKNMISKFLEKNEVEELQILLEADNFSKNKKVASILSENKQLKTDVSLSTLCSNIDLIITFAQKKLAKRKLIKFLLFIGEELTAKGSLEPAKKVYLHLLKISENKSSNNKTRAKAIYGLGDIYSRQADWEKSISYLKQAEIIFKSIDEKRDMAKCENILGTINVELGAFKKAKKHFETALTHTTNKKTDQLRGMLESNLGILDNIQGNYDQANIHFQKALQQFELNDNHQRLSEVHHNLGMVYLEKRNYKSGLKEFDRAFTHANKSDNRQIMCIACISKAHIFVKLNQYSLADAFAVKAMDIATKINDKLSIADIYKIRGLIQKERKNFTLSENYLNTSLRINTELDNILNQAETLYEMGFLYRHIRDFKRSKYCFNDSLKKYKKLKIKNKIKEITEELKL